MQYQCQSKTQNVAVQSKCSAPLEVGCFLALASEHSHTVYIYIYREKISLYMSDNVHTNFLPCVTVLV